MLEQKTTQISTPPTHLAETSSMETLTVLVVCLTGVLIKATTATQLAATETETKLNPIVNQQLQAAQPIPGCKTHQHQEQDAVVMMDLMMIPTTDQQTHPQPHP